MSDNVFTLFGVELGSGKWIPAEIRRSVDFYGDFEVNEIGKSLGLTDSHLLEVHYKTGDIFARDRDVRTKLNHSISLGMNVPVIDTIGE